MKFNKQYNIEQILKVATIVLCVIRVLLQMGIPVNMIASASVDDALFVDYANNIFAGNWLGDYSVYTLNKVPGFAFFLVAIKLFNIPYMLAVGVLYTLASYVFYIAIKKFVKNEIVSFLLFAYVLFSPVMIGNYMVSRIYRMTIVPIAVLLLISSYLGIYANRKEKISKIVPWSVLAGCAYAGYSLLREDTIWISCFVFGATLIIMVLLVIEKGDIFIAKLKRAIIFLLPVIICFMGITTIKTINYDKYGLYETDDFGHTYYSEMGKKILKIQSDYEVEHVWITRGTVEKLYEVSPTFATLKPYLDEIYPTYDTWGFGAVDGEIERDYVTWAIRWAAGKAGVYDQGAEYANEFYKNICDEIDAAYENGKLLENDNIILSNLARPFNLKEDIVPCLKTIAKGLYYDMTYSTLKCIVFNSTGAEQDIIDMSSMASTVRINASNSAGYAKSVAVANLVIKVYQYTAWIAIILSMGIYVVELIYNIYQFIKKKSCSFVEWLIKTGMLLTIFANMLVVCVVYFESEMSNGAIYGYTVGVYPIWHIFVCLNVCTLYNFVEGKMKEKKIGKALDVSNDE